ncbi:hypothetical protein [Pseudomonas sichuanensis]|uniref:hypothetical protein n=1 Tax=Pseudomonas sichuanensis TaxID=2213015 RepID=UPI002B40FAC1|nr:hypothetical protein [Pseudomonas sichuanensis]
MADRASSTSADKLKRIKRFMGSISHHRDQIHERSNDAALELAPELVKLENPMEKYLCFKTVEDRY